MGQVNYVRLLKNENRFFWWMWEICILFKNQKLLSIKEVMNRGHWVNILHYIFLVLVLLLNNLELFFPYLNFSEHIGILVHRYKLHFSLGNFKNRWFILIMEYFTVCSSENKWTTTAYTNMLNKKAHVCVSHLILPYKVYQFKNLKNNVFRREYEIKVYITEWQPLHSGKWLVVWDWGWEERNEINTQKTLIL